jgi:hypothetical protein
MHLFETLAVMREEVLDACKVDDDDRALSFGNSREEDESRTFMLRDGEGYREDTDSSVIDPLLEDEDGASAKTEHPPLQVLHFVWCVCGVWCVVCGVWCVVYGVWCVVCGTENVRLSLQVIFAMKENNGGKVSYK